MTAHRIQEATTTIHLNCLSAKNPKTNQTLFTSLHKCGLTEDLAQASSGLITLDWSHADGASADAVAFFSVLINKLAERNQIYRIVGPADSQTHALINDVSETLELPKQWSKPKIASFTGSPIELVAAVKIEHEKSKKNIAKFVNTCASTLEAQTSSTFIDQYIGCINELIANAIEHSGSGCTAVAVRLPRRRPAILQIGIADGGPGVAETILREDRYAGMTSFPDSTLMEAVFYRAFSRRPLEDGGGALGRMFSELTAIRDAQLIIRSGRGWISNEKTKNGFRRTMYTWGLGTQALLSIRLRH